MRNAKSSPMFKKVAEVLIDHISCNLKENKFAEGFKKFYLHEKRSNWYHTSTKRPGVSSDSNTLENHNNTGKIERMFIATH